MVRTEATADDSLAAMRARNRFGMAMAAMIKMIATTMSNSISEKPFCFRISISLFSPNDLNSLVSVDPIAEYVRILAAIIDSYEGVDSQFSTMPCFQRVRDLW